VARTPSDICETMGFTLVLRGHGWIDIVIAFKSVTGHSDALQICLIFGRKSL